MYLQIATGFKSYFLLLLIIMEKKRTRATDLAEIAAALDGKVDFQTITFDQILTKEHGESVNDLLFIGEKWGIYFYTSRADFDGLCYLQTKEMPTKVVCKGSKNVYLINNKINNK